MAELGLNKHKPALILVAGLLTIQIAAVVLVLAKERASLPRGDDGLSPKLTPGNWWRENHARPTLRPATLKANEAGAWLLEPIIGVEVAGKARAYRVGAFDDASGHVVNDLIGGVPVTVAHCNLSRSARVYADPAGTAPLDAEAAGLLNDRMVMKLGGVLYYHTTGEPVEPDKNPRPIPYLRVDPVLTTWEQWVRQHPASDLFVGNPRTFPRAIPGRPDSVNDPARQTRAQERGTGEVPTPPRPRSGP